MSSNSICNHTRDKQNISDSRCVVVPFCYHLYDYKPNWTPLSPITITYMLQFVIATILPDKLTVNVGTKIMYILTSHLLPLICLIGKMVSLRVSNKTIAYI